MDLSFTADALMRSSELKSEVNMSTLHLHTEPTVTPTVTLVDPPVIAVNGTNTTDITVGAYDTDTVTLTCTDTLMHKLVQNNEANMNTTINISTEPTVIPKVEPTAPFLVGTTSPLLITGNTTEVTVASYDTDTVALTGTVDIAVTAAVPDGGNTG